MELVEDRATKKNFAGDKQVAQRIQAEMMKRGVVTRTRPSPGPHPAPGDSVYFAPPPQVVANFCAAEAEGVWNERHPIMWKLIKARGLLG